MQDDPMRRPLMLRLDADVSRTLAEMADDLGVNQTALMQAAAEALINDWRAHRMADVALVRRAKEIEQDRRARQGTHRRKFMVRINVDLWASYQQVSAVAGPRMSTAMVQAIIEYWVGFWNVANLSPAYSWRGTEPEPGWWPLWERLKRRVGVASQRTEPRRAVVLRLDAESADALIDLAGALRAPLTATVEGMLDVCVRAWVGVFPAEAWTLSAEPPPWFEDWLDLIARTRQIAGERGGGGGGPTGTALAC